MEALTKSLTVLPGSRLLSDLAGVLLKVLSLLHVDAE
jgi:hypothetical protein